MMYVFKEDKNEDWTGIGKYEESVRGIELVTEDAYVFVGIL